MDRPIPLFPSHSGHISRQTSASTAPVIGTTSVPLLYFFLAFQLADQVFLPILIATFFLSKTVKRHPTVVNACVTWIITGFISSLLLYAGKHVGPEPPTMLCITQASMLNGVVPMNSISVLALMLQVNYNIRQPKAQTNGMRTYTLLVAPYITFFSFSTSAAIFAVQKPQNVSRERRFFYCSLASPVSNAFAIFSAFALITALGFAVCLGVFLRKDWHALRQAGSIDLQFLSRVAGFVLYVFIALIVSLLSIFSPRNPFPDLFAASAGTALFLFLGTQRDVWYAWFRRSSKLPLPPPLPSNDTQDDNNILFQTTSNTVIDIFMGAEYISNNSRGQHNFKGQHDLDVDIESMGGSTALDPEIEIVVGDRMGRQGLDLSDAIIKTENITEDFGGGANGKEVAVMHSAASLIPRNTSRFRYPQPSLVGQAGDVRASHDVVQGQGVVKNVVSSYRFARPGMI